MSWEPPTAAAGQPNTGDLNAPLTTAFSNSSDAPPWLSDGGNGGGLTNNGDRSGISSDSVRDTQVPKLITYTRIANLILSSLMIVVSLLCMLTATGATSGVLACYVVVFSCLLCCFETKLKMVSKIIATNFGFMYSAKARVVYMIMVGTILFSFSGFLAFVVGLAMVGNALFNAYIIVKHPSFEEEQRRSAQADIQDFLKSNPAFAQKAMSFGLGLGATFSSLSTSLDSSSNGTSNETKTEENADSVAV